MKKRHVFIHSVLCAAAAVLFLVPPAASAFDWQDDVKLKVGIVDESLGKIKIAVKNGEIQSLSALIDDYEIAVRRTTDGVDHARRNGHDVSGVASHVHGKYKKNTAVLESLLAKVPPQARKGILRAIENSKKHRGRMGKAKGHYKEHPGKGRGKGKHKNKRVDADSGSGMDIELNVNMADEKGRGKSKGRGKGKGR